MLKKIFKEEKGQTLILVPIFLFVLMGFAGLAIDGGKLYLAKSQLQKAVDAGALAGADFLKDKLVAGLVTKNEYDAAKDQAGKIPEDNYNSGTYTPKAYRDSIIDGECSDKVEAYGVGECADYVQVYGEEDVHLLLMPVLGIDTGKVSAFAKVKIGEVNTFGKGSVIPVGIHLDNDSDIANDPQLQFGTLMSLNLTASNSGWYNFLDFSSIDPNKANQGTKDLANYFVDKAPSDITINETEIAIREGNPKEQVNQKIDAMEGQIVYVPIVGPVHDITITQNGTSKTTTGVTVLGFAVFKLVNYDDKTHTIQAMFLRLDLDGSEIGDTTSKYGTYDSKLEI